MLVLEDNVTIDDLKPYGFHSFKCKGFTRYYRCFSRGCKLMMISVKDRTTPNNLAYAINREIMIDDWYENDPRIHKTPKCSYRSTATPMEIIYELSIEGFLKRV